MKTRSPRKLGYVTWLTAVDISSYSQCNGWAAPLHPDLPFDLRHTWCDIPSAISLTNCSACACLASSRGQLIIFCISR